MIPSRSHRLARAVAAGGLVIGPLTTAPTAHAAQPSAGLVVSARTKISGPVDLAAGCSAANGNGPHIAIDPSEPSSVSVVYSLGEGTAGVAATSRDHGQSWTRAPVPGMTPCTGSTGPDAHVGDPMIDIGGRGDIAVTESWIRWTPDVGVDHDAVRLYSSRSSDGGDTFTTAVEPDPGGADQRGPVSFDPASPNTVLAAFERVHYLNPPSPLDGASTFLFALGSSLGVVRSDDGGATWPNVVTATQSGSGEELATVALLRSGADVVLVGASIDDRDLAAVMAKTAQYVPERLFTIRSTDGGAHWTDRHPVPGVYDAPHPTNDVTPGCCIPDATVGPDGRLYLVWADATSNQLVVADSADAGDTWNLSKSTISTGDIVEPAIAARPDGTLAVSFYDHVASADGVHSFVTPALAVSHDGAATWTTMALAPRFDVKLVAASACPNQACDGTPMGPYQDIVATPSGLAVAVTLADAQTAAPTSEDVWWIAVTGV